MNYSIIFTEKSFYQEILFLKQVILQNTVLQIFSHERKFYNREALAKHRRVGDDDDQSHRGHPLCEFCDHRYLDNDELVGHLRKDHYFCHFCDADGISNQFYRYILQYNNFNTVILLHASHSIAW